MTKCVQKSPTPGSLRHPARIISATLAIALALSATSVAQPAAGPVQQHIEGWPMAKWGMTEPEVLKAFGGAAKSLTEEAGQSTDSKATLGLEDAAIGGVSFRALFLFDPAGKLVRIQLDGLTPSFPPIGHFRKVEDYLARKYGEPVSGTTAMGVRSVWVLQNSVIELDYAPMATVALSFERRDGQTKESVKRGLTEIHRTRSLDADLAESAPPAKSPSRVDPISAARMGKWRLSKSTSQFDDSSTVVVTLAAENIIRGWLATSTPQLILRCQEKRTEMYVAVGMSAAVEYGEVDRHTVRLRYGDDAAFNVMMSQSTDNKSLFFPDPMNKIIAMWNVQQLLVGFTPFNASPVTIRFNVSGLPNAIQPLREACGW